MLPLLAPQSFDALVTDPPFGIGFKYNEHDDSPEGYGKWLWSIIERAELLLKPGSPVFIWQAMPNVRNFAEWFPRDWRLFAAIKNYVAMYPSVAMQYCWDPVVVWWTKGKRFISDDNYRARDFHYADTSKNGMLTHTIEAEHPCPRPLEQVAYVIHNWVRPNGTVLDLFLGSGTTALAAKRLRMSCVGVEKDESYFKIATQRLVDEDHAGCMTEMRKQITKLQKQRAKNQK
jgi:DNA modification methylase